MLAITRPENRQRAEGIKDPSPPFADLLSIPTTRGTYFVPGDYTSIRALVRQERLKASDLLRHHHDYQPFLRRLFMLATQEALLPHADRRLRELVRALRQE